MQTQTTQAYDFDLAGRTVSATMAAYDRHVDKAFNMMKSTAITLLEVKERLPRGEFDPWLEKHGIARSTAYRWIQEFKDPQSKLNRRKADRDKKAEERAQAACRPAPEPPKSPRSGTNANHQQGGPCDTNEPRYTAPEPPKRKASKPNRPPARIEEQRVRELVKKDVLSRLPDETLREIIRLIESNT